jgi:hypothetical protein
MANERTLPISQDRLFTLCRTCSGAFQLQSTFDNQIYTINVQGTLHSCTVVAVYRTTGTPGCAGNNPGGCVVPFV